MYNRTIFRQNLQQLTFLWNDIYNGHILERYLQRAYFGKTSTAGIFWKDIYNGHILERYLQRTTLFWNDIQNRSLSSGIIFTMVCLLVRYLKRSAFLCNDVYNGSLLSFELNSQRVTFLRTGIYNGHF